MADDRVVEIVNEFFLSAGLPRPRFDENAIAVICQSLRVVSVSEHDTACDDIPLSTGSVAEFYIDPMLPCIGDVDIMVHGSDELAIPQGHPPPTQLPAEFHGRVRVYEVIDSEFPGYVYLVSSYVLREIDDCGKYNAVQCERKCAGLGHELAHKFGEWLHGPAIVSTLTAQSNEVGLQLTIKPFSVFKSMLSTDFVTCVRCLSWAPQAADWPKRHRNYGWPDSATVDRVVSNGCDVVRVAHRLCKQHEWMSKCQFRLSFSRAEIILINSWKPVQQVIYHMLRFFMKAEPFTDITDGSESKILSNYNIKTLMLWACEMKQRIWWTDELNFVGICVKLLHILAVWLTDARCKHYFINNCNLFDSLDNSHLTQNTASKLRLTSVTEAWLAEWFVNNYIRNCTGDLCPDEVSRLFDDISAPVKLKKAVSALVYWRLSITCVSAHVQFETAQLATHIAYFGSPSVKSCSYLMRELSKIDEGLSVYFTAVTFLHVAFKINSNPLTDEMLDVLSTVCLKSNDARRCLNARHSSVLSLSQAAKLMKVIANNSRSTVQLIEIELSKAYLYRALRCKDSDSDSIYCLANVYLAVLYYTTGQYQKAIDHCTVVTRSRNHLQCSSHVVQGELLPKVDDDIDGALGLAVFYQYVRTAALNQQQQTQHVSVFSTELFAHYLHIRCQSVVKCHQFTQMLPDEVHQYKKCFSESSQIFVTDVILFDSVHRAKYSANSAKPSSSRERTKPVTSGQLDTSELVELLQKSAAEHLTVFRQHEARFFGSAVPIVTTDFEALYAYKRGEYHRCFELSTQNVHTLIGADKSPPNVLTHSDFIQLMDDNLVCLIGLTLFVHPSCREPSMHVAITQLSLSLYLMTQCQMKLHHPVTSLAQTLLYIEVARHKHNQILTLDQLLLKLTEHKVLRYTSLDS